MFTEHPVLRVVSIVLSIVLVFRSIHDSMATSVPVLHISICFITIQLFPICK